MNTLKIYCHTKATIASSSPPIACHEVSFLASPEVLREVAAFLTRSADLFESDNARADHIHLRDEWIGWDAKDSADVIAVKPEN